MVYSLQMLSWTFSLGAYNINNKISFHVTRAIRNEREEAISDIAFLYINNILNLKTKKCSTCLLYFKKSI